MIIYRIPSRAKGLIFDMDMTLYRHEEYYDSQMKNQGLLVASQLGKSEETLWEELHAAERAFMDQHQGKKPSFGNLLKLTYGIPIEASVELRRKAITPEKYLKPDLRLFETLKALQESYQLVLLTNNPSDIAQKTLKVLGVLDFFPKIIGLEHTSRSKPSPEPFRAAQAALGINEEEIISIGDRYPVDLEVPLSWGMGGVLVESMEDVYQLPEVLRDSGRES